MNENRIIKKHIHRNVYYTTKCVECGKEIELNNANDDTIICNTCYYKKQKNEQLNKLRFLIGAEIIEVAPYHDSYYSNDLESIKIKTKDGKVYELSHDSYSEASNIEYEEVEDDTEPH